MTPNVCVQPSPKAVGCDALLCGIGMRTALASDCLLTTRTCHRWVLGAAIRGRPRPVRLPGPRVAPLCRLNVKPSEWTSPWLAFHTPTQE